MRSHQILGCASVAAAASIGGVNQTLGRVDAQNADANRYPNQCLFLERYCANRWHYRYTVGNATETSVRSRFWQLYKTQGVEKLFADYLLLIRLPEQARKPQTPRSPPLAVGNQVLANFDRNVM